MPFLWGFLQAHRKGGKRTEEEREEEEEGKKNEAKGGREGRVMGRGREKWDRIKKKKKKA